MRENWIKSCGCAVAVVLVAAAASHAQYSSGFETLTATADGFQLDPQDLYYLPNPTSTSFEVYTYSANTWSLPQNLNGGTQFIAGVGEGGGTFERAQRDLNYGNGTGSWTIGFDMAARGFGTAAQNLGSVSIQPFPGSQSFIALARWTTLGTDWQADYVWYDAAGVQSTSVLADPRFQNLALSHWYRWETDFNLTTNEITEVRLTDISAGTTATFSPVGRYMEGGLAGGATPTGFRFFAGSSTAGQGLAFDNIEIIPAPGVLALLGLGGLVATRRRR